MTTLNRRDFLRALGVGGTMVGTLLGSGSPPPTSSPVKPISGCWFEYQHHATVEGVDWNPALANFSSDQWDLKIKEIAETGMEYLVLMATALYYRSFYHTKIFPAWRLACDDPMEAVLSAADKYGIKFFIGGGFSGRWVSPGPVAGQGAGKKQATEVGESSPGLLGQQKFIGYVS